MRLVRPHLGERYLVRAPGALDLDAVHLARARPALRRSEDDHRARVVERPVEQLREATVHRDRVLAVEAAREEERLVPVAAHERCELLLRDPREHRRVRDLVAVQVQDRQHAAVRLRIHELVRVPARRERPGLRLAVADDAGDEQPRVVEGGAVRVRERVAELAALVDRAGRLGRRVARDPARERELAEELAAGRPRRASRAEYSSLYVPSRYACATTAGPPWPGPVT